MELENSKKRIYPGYMCKCCLRNSHNHKLIDMWGVNLVESDLRVYGEMITECFAISWQKPVNRAELICESCIERLLNAFEFKRDVLSSARTLLELLADEDNPCNEIVKEEDVIDDNTIQEDLIPDEEDKDVSDNLKHFKEAVTKDDLEGLEYLEILYFESSIDVEQVKQEKAHTNLLQPKNRNENCKDLPHNKLVPVVVLDRYIPKKTELLKQRKTETTNVLENQGVIKTHCSPQLTKTHEVKGELNEITYEFSSNTLLEKKGAKITDYKLQTLPSQPELISERISSGDANKIDSTQQTPQYSAEDLQLGLNAVKSEQLTAVAASALYNIPISILYRFLAGDKDKQNETASSSVLKHPSPCALCGQDISSSSSPTRHKCARATNTSSRDIEEQGEQAATKFTCDICKRNFKLKSSLYRHIMHIHKFGKKSEILFTCKFCKQVFSNNYFLMKHQRMHTGEKPYSCNVCNKQFSQSSSLIMHQRIHTGEKPYSCNVCNKQFTQNSQLIVHQRIHTGDKPYSCKICNYQFSQRWLLKSHQRVHSDEKPYLCKICNRQFTKSSALVTHQRIHTGEKRHSCKICHRQFSQKGHLIIHQRFHTYWSEASSLGWSAIVRKKKFFSCIKF